MRFPKTTLNCGGRLLDLSRPRIMGIINLTPDSFYAASRKAGIDESLAEAEKMLAEGADILDLGAMSSRPGAELIGTNAEQDRLLPSLEAIVKAHPEAIISVDTIYAGTAKAAVAAGASIINDISAGTLDEQMLTTIPSLGVPYVMMHMRGKPADMQQQTDYENLLVEIVDFLAPRIEQLTQDGQHDIVIDPGFGFGKTVEQNYELLDRLGELRLFDRPILAGLSRKSMIWRPLGIKPENALNGTTALNMAALERGASILRVHDVAEAREVVELFIYMKKYNFISSNK
ncbi:MAG: dihydropteroate synthase [Bacteroidota bacterium]